MRTSAASSEPLGFLNLPAEIRAIIYHFALSDAIIEVRGIHPKGIQQQSKSMMPFIDQTKSRQELLATYKTINAKARQQYLRSLTLIYFGILWKETYDHSQGLWRTFSHNLHHLWIYEFRFAVVVLKNLPSLKTLTIGAKNQAGCIIDLKLVHDNTKQHCHELGNSGGRRVVRGARTLDNILAIQKRSFTVSVFTEIYVECLQSGDGLVIVIQADLDTGHVVRAFDEDDQDIDVSEIGGDAKLDNLATHMCRKMELGLVGLWRNHG